MQILIGFGVILVAYLMGSIPFGLLIVRLKTGKDLRQVESGRTGGTNALRAAGTLAGITTGLLDATKGACGVWLADAVISTLLPGAIWLKIFSPLAAILGHNYSIFLMERTPQGKLRLRGGAGGGPTAGAVFALWPPSLFIVVPMGFLVWYFVGYASLTTMSAPVIAGILFAVRASLGLSPWEYVIFAVLAEFLLMWALRPNIQRLIQGNERLVGWRARKSKSIANPSKP